MSEPDNAPTSQPAPETAPAPAAPFAPEPLPASSFADLKSIMGVVPLKYPVVFGGKTWTEIHLRVFTTAQVAAVIRNYDARLKVDPDAVLSFPVYVDAEGADVPDGLIPQLAQDDVDDLQARAGDFLPRRFRPTKAEATAPGEDPSTSTPASGGPTAASS